MSEDITYAWLGGILKAERDGEARIVYGVATDGSLDSDDQICDPAWAKKAMAEWFDTGGNVRQMHSTNIPPAGKGISLESTAAGEIVKSRVVEPTAVRLVDEGVYQGYSVGISRPRIERDSRARGGRIVGGRIVELSLVDRPANSMAKFQLAKMDGGGNMQFIGKSVAVPGRDPDAAEDSVDEDQQETTAAADDAVADAGKAETPDTAKADVVECDKCSGSGKVDGEDCDKCSGSGKVDKVEEVDDEGAPAEGEEAPAADEPHDESKPHDEEAEDPAEEPDSDYKAPPFEKKTAESRVEKQERRIAKAAAKEAAKAARAHASAAAQERATADATEALVIAKAALPNPAGPDVDEGVPWLVRRLHDFTCAAYKTADVLEAYPSIEKNGSAAAFGPSTRSVLYSLICQELEADAGTGSRAFAVQELGKAMGSLQAFLDEDATSPVSGGDLLLAARDDLHDAFKSENALGPDAEGNPGDYPKPTETISAAQFRRPFLTDGRASETPGSHATPDLNRPTHPLHPKVDAISLGALHDAIASWKPEICRMDANGSNAFDRQPTFVPVASAANNAGAQLLPQPVAASAASPGEHAGAVAASLALADQPTARTLTAADIEAIVNKAVGTAVEPHLKKISTLEAQIDELGSAPDPRKAAHRGVVQDRLTKAATVGQASREAMSPKRAAKAEYYRQLARSDDPELRIHAGDWLAKRGIEPN